ncbi:uncharacterized protein [Phaseolus vulgaris]|uniref:uncharacterized protein n=1 Tax=Phaseolus vulgaris TaxID=3885 RepID=UPI0035CBBDF6
MFDADCCKSEESLEDNVMEDTSFYFNRCTNSIGESYISFNGCIDSMGQNSLSFSGSTDSIAVTDSVLPSVSSGLETLLPYIDGSNYPLSQQFEIVKREQITWEPDQVDNSSFTPLQMSAMLDSYIYETCEIGYPSDEPTVFDNSQNYVNLHDLEFPGINVDGNMVFPTLEDTLGVSYYNYGFQYCDPLWFNNLLCEQAIPFTQELDSDRVDHIHQETFTGNCSVPSDDEVHILPALVNQEISKKKNTLVLDLDETLVHSSLENCDADFTFQMITNRLLTVYVRKRPFLQEFLTKVSDMFEVIIFTASQSTYAAKVLDVLDPNNKLFARRMYRESCTWKDHRCVKDLTVLGIDLAKVFIIDNTPEVFRFQVNNGIPIKSWYDDPSDCSLLALLSFLEKLVDVDDVRPIIAKEFGAKN